MVKYKTGDHSCHTHARTSILLGLQQLAQETQVEDLELLFQVHADDAVLAINAQQDTGRLPILSKDDLDLQNGGGAQGDGAEGWTPSGTAAAWGEAVRKSHGPDHGQCASPQAFTGRRQAGKRKGNRDTGSVAGWGWQAPFLLMDKITLSVTSKQLTKRIYCSKIHKQKSSDR